MWKALVAFVLVLSMSAGSGNTTEYKTLSPAEFAVKLKKGTPIVLDVRPAHLFQAWRLRCANCTHINLPIEIGAGDFFIDDIKSHPRLRNAQNTEILVVCWVGVLSREAAQLLTKHGYTPLMLRGGLDALPPHLTIGVKPDPPLGG